MADDLDIPVAPPKEALDYFRRKGFTPSFSWQDVWQEEHARAFTVAKAMTRDILETIRDAVDQAIADGTTLDTFRRELTPKLQELGWWGRKTMIDPLTAEAKTVQLGSPKRLETIFNINLRTAYQTGRWERLERQKTAFPFLRYIHSDASRNARPEHVAWDGTIKPVDDPWWDTHYGPCGWGCKCTAVAYNQRQLDKNGWHITEEPTSFPKVSYLNKRTGEVSQIERGIDPGWSYNVGKAPLAGITPARLLGDDGASVASAASGGSSGALTPFFAKFDISAADARRGKVFIDKDGWPLPVSLALFEQDGRLVLPNPADLRLLAAAATAIVSPARISWQWTTVRNGASALVRRYTGAGITVEFGRSGWRFFADRPATAAGLPMGVSAMPIDRRGKRLVQLFPPYGAWTARNGTGTFTIRDRAQADAIVRSTFAALGTRGLTIDYDHQSVRAPKRPFVPAGNILTMEVRDDGIWAVVNWTSDATIAINAREYRYLIPRFLHDPSGAVTRIVGAGLDNSPTLDLPPIAAESLS
ncbi:phage minor head protein [Sphingomonas sp. RP10(2022)]|uniref:Phage minor head protein n=1 Tax=Sphingomonas liriopis TaxID=2949094 RepID=A0A9X2I180_9SPHN|nr:phage protease [Sphingomonas liriopis]MCP3735975.1 phage minor head protein [Sphingomonas liriopis]